MIEVDCRKCVNCTGEECISLEQALKAEYNKAIDDFVKEVKNLIVDLSVIRFKDIDEIAEQLKAGGKDEWFNYSKIYNETFARLTYW